MKFLEILRLVMTKGQEILDLFREIPFDEITDMPEWRDLADVQRWCLALCKGADEVADLTDTAVDDDMVARVRAFVESDMFGYAHVLLVNLLLNNVPQGPKPGTPEDTFTIQMLDAINAPKADGHHHEDEAFPVWVIPLIIEGVKLLVSWIRTRDVNYGGTPPAPTQPKPATPTVDDVAAEGGDV